jgi:dipeptidyl aminopeptidase/acylaminoacyl peptidase
MKSLLAAGLVLVGMAGVGWAQGAKRPMTFADLMAMKRVSDPQISPSGKWVLFSVMDVSLEKNTRVNHLWAVPLTGGGPEHQVTSGVGENFGRFAPNGMFVSYTSAPTKDDPYSRITIATWDESTGTIGVGRTLQAVSGDADGAIWSPDSRHFLFTTEVYPECSDKPIWTEEDACDKAKDDAADASPVKAQLFTHLLFRHWNGFTGLKRTHILEADFSRDGANPRDLSPRSAVGDAETPTFSLGGPLGYAWAPDSKEIAYVTNLDPVPAASTNNDVFTLRLDVPGAKAVKVSTSLGSDDGPQYSPDGKWLAFRSQKRAGYESDRFRLMVFDRQAKTIREVLPKFDRWVDEFTWTPDSQRIFFAAANTGNEDVFSAELSGRDLLRIGGGSVEDGLVGDRNLRGENGDLHVSPNGKELVVTYMSEVSPAEVYVWSELQTVSSFVEPPWHQFSPGATYNSVPLSKSLHDAVPDTQSFPKALTHLNDKELSLLELGGSGNGKVELTLEALSKVGMHSYWFTGADGAKIEGFIVKPPNFDPKKKYPVKFLIHGGPQGAWGDAWSYRWNPELMAASGYVVVMVNPRGSTGYGQAFIDGVNGDWGGKPYIDLMRGLDAAEAQFPFIDKTRECALGASYGGFMANWILTHTTRFKCIVTHDGMYNPAAAYGDTDELWFNEWEFRRAGDYPEGTKAGQPGQPWRYAGLPADQDPFRKWSPMLHIQDAKTPTLVIHSQRDYRLDVSEGYQLFTALQRLGVPSEMLYFPDEGHWVLKPQNAELWNKTVSDWCDKWTKP